jgi:glycosyltransferase involved in cell wall biosynthesis
MAIGTLPLLTRLRRRPGFDLIDAHFAYPEGYAASLLGKWLSRGVTITLRGTEARMLQRRPLRRRILTALGRARRVFSVAEALRQKAVQAGAEGRDIQVVGNGVDSRKFYPINQDQARKELGLPSQGCYLVSVGGLVERKGFHRVIEILPELLGRFPDLHYLIVGGSSSEGSWEDRLRDQVRQLGLTDRVHFLGVFPPERLYLPLSAADRFVLATRNEGWANVFLEAMACGLPVITTDVGGNREVVRKSSLGRLVPFGDRERLRDVLAESLETTWDAGVIRAYAEANSWEVRVQALVAAFQQLTASGPSPTRARPAPGEGP